MQVRPADAGEIDHLARLWHDVWHGSHATFAAPEAHGSGVAAALIADAEARLAARGVETAWLACAIGNTRAARFYEKSGWRRVGTVINPAETSSGPFPLEVWRYEKRLTRST